MKSAHTLLFNDNTKSTLNNTTIGRNMAPEKINVYRAWKDLEVLEGVFLSWCNSESLFGWFCDETSY